MFYFHTFTKNKRIDSKYKEKECFPSFQMLSTMRNAPRVKQCAGQLEAQSREPVNKTKYLSV
jgi:hypothetical protein